MTVKELREKLKQFDENTEVFVDLYVLPIEPLEEIDILKEGNMILFHPVKGCQKLEQIWDKVEDFSNFMQII